MKKLTYIIIGIVIAATSFMSCGDDDSIDLEEITEQSLLVYMPWSGSASGDNGLYNIFKENLDSIEQAVIENQGLRQNKLFVFLSTSPTNSTLYEITYSGNQIKHTVIQNYEGKSYTTSEGIASILNTFVANSDNALNYALIIGCHGNGWTFKEDWTNYPYRIRTRSFGSASDLANYSTDISTLAEGIATSNIGTSGRKLQYILFDDCYMANIETAYELRNVTNFLIASTSEILDIGMPYRSIWDYLSNKTPEYSNIVNTFHDFYSHYDIPSGALSAIDCRQTDSLAVIMKQINESYTLADSLRDSVQVLDGFNTPIFFDMGSYVENLNINSRLYSRFHTQLNKVVPYKATSASIYSKLYDTPKYLVIKDYSGITISDISRNSVALKGRKKTAWWKATH